MRLLAIICALLLTTVLSALDLTQAQLVEVAKAAKGVPVGASASLVLTKADGTKVIVAIASIEGAVAVIIGNESFAFTATTDASGAITGFSLRPSGKPAVTYAADGSVVVVKEQPKVGTQQAAAEAKARAMRDATQDALLTSGVTPAALATLQQNNALTTLTISNGTILSQSTP